MAFRLRDAPWWVLALGSGLYFAVFLTVWGFVLDGIGRQAVGTGVIGGVIYGAIRGPISARRRQMEREQTPAPGTGCWW